jgi:hypothetical protein
MCVYEFEQTLLHYYAACSVYEARCDAGRLARWPRARVFERLRAGHRTNGIATAKCSPVTGLDISLHRIVASTRYVSYP